MQQENKKVSKVLEPLMNQIVFGDSNKPVFDSGKSKLSDEFSHVYSNYGKPFETQLLENHIETQIQLVLKNFTEMDRAIVFQLLFKDPIFMEGMMAIDILTRKDKSAINFAVIEDEIRTGMEDYYDTGNVNVYINWYFKLFFEGLFRFEFVNKNYATQEEYQRLYDSFTEARPLMSF